MTNEDQKKEGDSTSEKFQQGVEIGKKDAKKNDE